MASDKEFLEYVKEQAELAGVVTSRPMMGEYLLYLDGVYFGVVCDDRFMVKCVDENADYGMPTDIPYDGAKPMYLVTDIDDKEVVRDIITATARGLKRKSKK